jgi:hypothetical protein
MSNLYNEEGSMHRLRILNIAAGIAFAAVLLIPSFASAASVSTGVPVTITQSYAYTSYGGGDFVFSTSIAVSGCESGWYMKTTDPGYKAAVSTVLAAQAAGLQVVVYGDTADLWSGSPSGHYCRLAAVGISS